MAVAIAIATSFDQSICNCTSFVRADFFEVFDGKVEGGRAAKREKRSFRRTEEVQSAFVSSLFVALLRIKRNKLRGLLEQKVQSG